jgi:hypothetical protein
MERVRVRLRYESVKHCVFLGNYDVLTCISSVSILKSYAVRLILANTSASVKCLPSLYSTTSCYTQLVSHLVCEGVIYLHLGTSSSYS